MGVSHRDLKPENILLKQKSGRHSKEASNMVVKVADLGAAKVLDRSDRRMNTPYVVSRYYRAPELILGSHYYDTSIDVWSAGCILFELMTRTPLFPGDSEGLQLLEQAQILGMPSDRELTKLSQMCEAPAIQLFKRNKHLGEVDFVRLITANANTCYTKEEVV